MTNVCVLCAVYVYIRRCLSKEPKRRKKSEINAMAGRLELCICTTVLNFTYIFISNIMYKSLPSLTNIIKYELLYAHRSILLLFYKNTLHHYILLLSLCRPTRWNMEQSRYGVRYFWNIFSWAHFSSSARRPLAHSDRQSRTDERILGAKLFNINIQIYSQWVLANARKNVWINTKWDEIRGKVIRIHTDFCAFKSRRGFFLLS